MAYKQARCSVTWFNHLQFTGGTSFQRSLTDLQKLVGVGADITWDEKGNSVLDESVPAFIQVYGYGTEGWDAKLEENVRTPILNAIDRGQPAGAFVVSHHIASPGVLMIEDFLSKFREDLESRGCRLVIASLVREPVMREVSSYLKFNPTVRFTPDLSSVLADEPAFPVLTGGGGAFEQIREFLFMDLCCTNEDILATLREKERVNPDFSAAGAVKAFEAFKYMSEVVWAVAMRSEYGLPHATLSGVLLHEVDLPDGQGMSGGGDAAQKFLEAKQTVIRTTQDFMNKFDVVLGTTEDEEEMLLRLTRKMDWHPELFKDTAGEAYNALRKSMGDTLNQHGEKHGGVDMNAVPEYARVAVNQWTELDNALYLVATSQMQAMRANSGTATETRIGDNGGGGTGDVDTDDDGRMYVCERETALLDASEIWSLAHGKERGNQNVPDMVNRLWGDGAGGARGAGCMTRLLEAERVMPDQQTEEELPHPKRKDVESLRLQEEVRLEVRQPEEEEEKKKSEETTTQVTAEELHAPVDKAEEETVVPPVENAKMEKVAAAGDALENVALDDEDPPADLPSRNAVHRVQGRT